MEGQRTEGQGETVSGRYGAGGVKISNISPSRRLYEPEANIEHRMGKDRAKRFHQSIINFTPFNFR